MKKNYIAPALTEIKLETETMLALSKKDESVDIDTQLSNDRRGDWGDIWAE